MRRDTIFHKYIRKVKYWKDEVMHELIIDGLNTDCIGEIQIIIDFLKKIAVDKNVFIETFGQKYVVEKKAILFCDESSEHHGFHKLQVDFSKINAGDKLFENIYTTFFVHKREVEWDNFIHMKSRKQWQIHFEMDGLLLYLFYTYDDGITFVIKNDYADYIDEFLENLRNEGFSIKSTKWRMI